MVGSISAVVSITVDIGIGLHRGQGSRDVGASHCMAWTGRNIPRLLIRWHGC